MRRRAKRGIKLNAVICEWLSVGTGNKFGSSTEWGEIIDPADLSSITHGVGNLYSAGDGILHKTGCPGYGNM